MKKTPSYLKGLAETRARLAGDIERYERVSGEIAEKLVLARRELEACDLLIRRFDGRVDPNKIPLISRWRHHPGKRGQFRGTVIEILQASAPNPVTTAEMSWELQLRFGLTFDTAEDYREWHRGSVARELRRLVAENLIERLHDPLLAAAEVGRWRWKTDVASSLTHLTEQLSSRGEAVKVVDEPAD